jgi:hypothetical protein
MPVGPDKSAPTKSFFFLSENINSKGIGGALHPLRLNSGVG